VYGNGRQPVVVVVYALFVSHGGYAHPFNPPFAFYILFSFYPTSLCCFGYPRTFASIFLSPDLTLMIHPPGNLGIGITASLVCIPFNTDECVNVEANASPQWYIPPSQISNLHPEMSQLPGAYYTTTFLPPQCWTFVDQLLCYGSGPYCVPHCLVMSGNFLFPTALLVHCRCTVASNYKMTLSLSQRFPPPFPPRYLDDE